MSTITNYPAKISRYTVKLSHTSAHIRLFGFENNAKDENETNNHDTIGDIHFSLKDLEADRPKTIINRGGFVSTNYPLTMLSSILILLHQNDALYINDDGSFTNHNNTIQS